MATTLFSILIVGIFGVIAGVPLLHGGLYPTHDGEYHVIRFYEFFRTLQDGSWYPRWAADLNNGYGLPLFNYVYPLPNYVASFFYVFGISFIDSFKLSMFISLLIGSIFFYLWSRKFWGNIGGVVCSIFYTFSPYHFVDIYIRGSIGEVWALAFSPVLLWAVSIALRERNRTFSVFSAVFLAFIVFSHNILALMFLVFVFTYIGFLIIQSKEKKYAIVNSVFIICLGLCLSMIFWLPALLEKNYVLGLQVYDIKNNFPQLYQLLIPSWGTGFSATSLSNQTSFQIGIANLLSVLLGSFVAINLLVKRKYRIASVVIFFMSLFMIIFFLMLKVSLPIWHLIPFMNYFQFPWRFLSLEILIASFLIGSIFKIWNSKILAFFLIICAVLLSIQYTRPAYYHLRDDTYYISKSNFINGTNSPGNSFNTIWFDTKLKKKNEKIVFSDNTSLTISQVLKTTRYSFNIIAKENTKAFLNTAYFPGWTVFIDGKRSDFERTPDGLIAIPIGSGRHMLEVKLLNTPVQAAAGAGTLLSSLFIFALFTRKLMLKSRDEDCN